MLISFNLLSFKFQAYGGDGILQRIKRIIYDAKSTVGVRKVLENIYSHQVKVDAPLAKHRNESRKV